LATRRQRILPGHGAASAFAASGQFLSRDLLDPQIHAQTGSGE
jgi:hypothetical protein